MNNIGSNLQQKHAADRCYDSDDEGDTFESSDLITATWRNIPEHGILHSRRRGNLKHYTALTGWTL
jgi:hypothetical protein